MTLPACRRRVVTRESPAVGRVLTTATLIGAATTVLSVLLGEVWVYFAGLGLVTLTFVAAGLTNRLRRRIRRRLNARLPGPVGVSAPR